MDLVHGFMYGYVQGYSHIRTFPVSGCNKTSQKKISSFGVNVKMLLTVTVFITCVQRVVIHLTYKNITYQDSTLP
jgi:hypothetical protein